MLTARPLLRARLPTLPRHTHTTLRSYHYTRRSPTLPASAPLRALLRSPTLRATSTVAQRAYALMPARTPSPPPAYSERACAGISVPVAWPQYGVRRGFSSTGLRWQGESASTSEGGLSVAEQTRVEALVEEITELFATAKDEFEIAAEETEKNTTYAEDDRAAAREELDRLLGFYKGVIGGEAGTGGSVVGDEVRRRVGHRIRELECAVIALEESVVEHD